ncbi:MAG: AAA family ATPase [Campylobacterota bacterium]|nr:AAA family ATPase [Campylobacterota bacterium]
MAVDKTQIVEVKLQDKISLWILRSLLNLGAHKEFINDNGDFRSDEIAYLVGLEKFVLANSSSYTKDNILKELRAQLEILEAKEKFTTSKILKKNIKKISKLISLKKHEKQILEFVILLNQYEVLEDSLYYLGSNLNTSHLFKVVSTVLHIPLKKVKDAFNPNSKLAVSSLVTLNRSDIHNVKRKIEVLSSEFIDNICHLDDDIESMLKESVISCTSTNLTLKDYEHIKNNIDVMVPYLQNSITNKTKGVNILLYGLPGTGKTELAKVIAEQLKVKLFEVSYINNENEAIDGTSRLKGYKISQALLSNENTLLLYDEAEDVFNDGGDYGQLLRQQNKAWFNKTLETNNIPTIWITNNIYSIDNALVRRFDMAIEVPIPKKSQREKILKTYANDMVSGETISKISINDNVAPALVSKASKVVSSLSCDNKDEVFTLMLNNTLKAQGYEEIKYNSSIALPNNYNPNFIHTTTNLEELANGIKETCNARLCLYGPAGTGKSAFGKYIADILDKKTVLKKGSDLQSKWVGECEKNIALAFEEAKDENSVLIFDEVDSFLSSRENAKASWEISQVNEMLVQMENFDGIFIATTNLMDNLDKASLRRFDMKLKFDYLNSVQSWKMFKSYAKELNLKYSDSLKSNLESLRYITPGDFAAIMRQNKFRPITNVKDLISRLEDEIAVKNVNNSRRMGFI